MKAYKGTDKNMMCRGFQYEIGKKYTIDGETELCKNGFHSCKSPIDALSFYKLEDSRFFIVEVGGKVVEDKSGRKQASSEIEFVREITINELRKEQTKEVEGGEFGQLVGGYDSRLVGGDYSQISGENKSQLFGGYGSQLVGGGWSQLAGGDDSQLSGGRDSQLVGGDYSQIFGGYDSQLVGGDWSQISGGDGSQLVGGDWSVLVGRNRAKYKGGKNSVIVLTEWTVDEEPKPVCVKAIVIDGEKYKPDTWYTLKDGEVVECE